MGCSQEFRSLILQNLYFKPLRAALNFVLGVMDSRHIFCYGKE